MPIGGSAPKRAFGRLSRALVQAGLSALLAVLLLLGFQPDAGATLKYKKDTGKKCLFCHTAVPREGEEDPKLNKDGKLFKENGYKLTEEQKSKPDPSES